MSATSREIDCKPRIEERLRTIIDQTNLHVQQAERFNQLISQYEERFGHIEEKQAEIVGNLQKSNQSIASLVERIELIEMQSKARFKRRILHAPNAIQTMHNEEAYLIIYCLNCIRCMQNSTFETGLKRGI